MADLEQRARLIAAQKMGLVKDPDGARLPDNLWRQAIPQAERELAQESLLAERDRLQAEVERLRGAVEWRPIETAPKDGTSIIAVISGAEPCVVQWIEPLGGLLPGWGIEPGNYADESHFEEAWTGSRYEPDYWLPLTALPQPPPSRSLLASGDAR